MLIWTETKGRQFGDALETQVSFNTLDKKGREIGMELIVYVAHHVRDADMINRKAIIVKTRALRNGKWHGSDTAGKEFTSIEQAKAFCEDKASKARAKVNK